MGIKTYQEKNTKLTEKDLAQSDLPVRKKMAIVSFHSLILWSNYYDMTIIMIAP